MSSNRRTDSIGGALIGGVRVRSDGSPAFVLWQNSETAATDVDDLSGFFNGSDTNFEANGLIAPTSGHGYLNLVHISSGTIATGPTVAVVGRLLPTTNGAGKFSELLADIDTELESGGPVVPLRRLGDSEGTTTFTIAGTAGDSTNYKVSDVYRVYVAGAAEVALAVTSAASVTGSGYIIGWFSS